MSWVHIIILPIAALYILSLPHMALDSPYQFMARGHIATSLQTLYKTRSSNIVAARDLYRIYVASSFESSRANQSPRRVIISITIMLIQVLMIPPELLTGHLLNSNATENVVRMTMVFSSCFALSAISVVYSSIDHNQVGQRRFLFVLVLIIMQLLFLVIPFDFSSLAILIVSFCIQFMLSVVFSAVATVYAVEVLPYHCRGMELYPMLHSGIVYWVRNKHA